MQSVPYAHNAPYSEPGPPIAIEGVRWISDARVRAECCLKRAAIRLAARGDVLAERDCALGARAKGGGDEQEAPPQADPHFVKKGGCLSHTPLAEKPSPRSLRYCTGYCTVLYWSARPSGPASAPRDQYEMKGDVTRVVRYGTSPISRRIILRRSYYIRKTKPNRRRNPAAAPHRRCRYKEKDKISEAPRRRFLRERHTQCHKSPLF